MKQINRQWRGWVKINPESPDTVIGRHTRWRRGTLGTATGAYPEPINIVAAAAYPLRPKKLADYCILYKDEKTNLWVQCIDVRSHSVEDGEEWLEVERFNGAVAVWSNGDAQPLRPEPAYVEPK